MIPFTDHEHALLYGAIKESLQNIRNPSEKTSAEVRGEIYTNLRRCQKIPRDLRYLVRGRRKHRTYGEHWSYIERMVEEMSKEHLRDPKDSLSNLKNILAGIRDAVYDITSVNNQGEKVLEKVNEIDKTLNPNGEANE